MSSLTGLSDSVSLGNQMLGDIRDENRGIIANNDRSMENYTLANQNEKSKRAVDDYWIGGSEGGALIGGIKNLVDARKTAKAYEPGPDTFSRAALIRGPDDATEGLTGAVFQNEDNIPAVRSATSSGGEAIAREGDSDGSGGITESVLGKTTGLTGSALKVGGKVLGNAGGLLDTFEGIDHLVQSGGKTIFGKDEGTASKVGDITQMRLLILCL